MIRPTTSCLLIGATLPLLLALPANAALISFNSRLLFDAAAPGLPVETFESGLVASASVTTCNGPLSSAASSACFAAGALLPGITYSASPGSGMALLGSGFAGVGNASKVLGPNGFADALDVTFTAASAIGLDVFAGPVAGNVLISVYDPSNVLLNTFTIMSPVGGTFFGLVTDVGTIGRLRVTSVASTPGELVDNVAFSQAAVAEPTTVMLLGIGLGASAAMRRRRQVKRPAATGS
jgi:hypothetical protein